MGWYESLFAAALVGGLSYVVDRGIAFHICLYSAIASGRKFTAEQAYREMDNPFARPSKILLVVALIVSAYVFGRRGEIHDRWQVAFIFVIALCYITVSIVTALKAFRHTRYAQQKAS